VWVVGGSAGMLGAAHLATRGAQRAGAGYVRLSSPGVSTDPAAPEEAVQHALPPVSWSGGVLSAIERFHALVIGPGLGRGDLQAEQVRELVAGAMVPVVVDGDGLFALGWSAEGAGPLLRRRKAPTVLTPHDGEYALLRGERPLPDRLTAARRLAADTGAVVLLKGPATVVAEPAGRVLVVTEGDERLATAGTGDVLAGLIGGLLAQHVPPFEAAASAAWIHGRAAQHAPSRGFVAGDLPGLVPAVLSAL
jgi:NAD(P)H-hydrate epimerase